MKKLALTIISLLGTALMASAQFGIVGAVGTLNSFEGMPVNNSSDKIYDSEVLTLGVDYGIKFTRHLSLIPGVRFHYVSDGDKVNYCKFDEGSNSIKTGMTQMMLEVPVVLKFAYPISANNALNLFAFGGASYNYGLVKNMIIGNNECIYNMYSGSSKVSPEISGFEINPEIAGTAPRGVADLVFGAGVGYGEGYSLFVQYNLGLTNFQTSGFNPAKHSWITVGFRYCPKIFRAEEERDF